ncbi:ComEC/Rec2 family competence protein [Ferviditalea candida]|uniref:MBL fold metallo-hydrolase n=1 Tax=Ferviditalea candida TaxID=3108399 RepID=A0ABU5ZF85_9BACL|nr:MBL fold metallo-hydrolase [Paenibacillaceae bacterium T2]
MTARVHFLNVGWGDAHIIELPSGALTLIDGGDGNPSDQEDSPDRWMDRRGFETLEWMILTHLHEDHLHGLLDVAKSKQVRHAVLPYRPFAPLEMETPETNTETEGSEGQPLASRTIRLIADYLLLIRMLQEKGTKIFWRDEWAETGHVVWAREGYKLLHLYPTPADALPARNALQRLTASEELDDRERETWLCRFFELSNHDSSVYRLIAEHHPQQSILFGADMPEAEWKVLSQRTDLRSSVWKAPHHGMKDAMTKGTLAKVCPEHVIIPISRDRSLSFFPAWEKICALTGSSFHPTGAYPNGMSLQMGGAFQVHIGHNPKEK